MGFGTEFLAGLEILNTQPALLSPEALTQLNLYRIFRHIVIHRDGFELQPQRIADLVHQLANCHAALTQDMQTFCQFLMAVDQSLP